MYENSYSPYRIRAKFQSTSLEGGHLFGSNSRPVGAVVNVLYFGIDATQGKWVFGRIGQSGLGIRFGQFDTDIHDVEYVYQEGCYFDGQLVPDTVAQAMLDNVSSQQPMGLFARCNQRNQFDKFSKAKIYSFQLYSETKLERNFIPAQRKADGVIGMYETVTKTFFTNAGTGEFIGG